VIDQDYLKDTKDKKDDSTSKLPLVLEVPLVVFVLGATGTGPAGAFADRLTE